MFQFPTFALTATWPPVPESLPAGSPIRTSAGRRVFAPHRSFSQLVTSFVASESHRHPPCALVRFLFSFRLAENLVPRTTLPPHLHALRHGHAERARERSICSQLLSSLCGIPRTAVRITAGTPVTCLIRRGRAARSFFQHVNDLFPFLFLSVVPGRLELPTSTLSV